MTTHRSMRGEIIDMAVLAVQNEKAVALGNAKMNARGDLIDTQGGVIKSRDTIANEYYTANPNAVKSVKKVALKDLASETFVTPAEAVAELTKANAKKTPTKRTIEDKE